MTEDTTHYIDGKPFHWVHDHTGQKFRVSGEQSKPAGYGPIQLTMADPVRVPRKTHWFKRYLKSLFNQK